MQTVERVVIASLVVAAGSLGARYLFADAAVPVVRTQTTALIGTWRLVEFWDRPTPASPLVYLYGHKPTGYFTYDPTGHVSIQIMRGPSTFLVDSARGEQWFEKATPEELRRATEAYRAYFGTYVVDVAQSAVVHKVEGDSRGLYTGTDQRRQYRLSGDTLVIGNSTTSHRKLVRVR